MQIRTEAGLRLHIEPPLDYSEDCEPRGGVTVKAEDASGDRPQVGLASARGYSGSRGRFLTVTYSFLCELLPSFTLAFISRT